MSSQSPPSQSLQPPSAPQCPLQSLQPCRSRQWLKARCPLTVAAAPCPPVPLTVAAALQVPTMAEGQVPLTAQGNTTRGRTAAEGRLYAGQVTSTISTISRVSRGGVGRAQKANMESVEK